MSRVYLLEIGPYLFSICNKWEAPKTFTKKGIFGIILLERVRCDSGRNLRFYTNLKRIFSPVV